MIFLLIYNSWVNPIQMKKLIIKETKMLHFIRAKYYYENDKERLKK